MLFFLINVLPIGEIQHPFGIRNVFNVSFRFRFVKPHKISTHSAHCFMHDLRAVRKFSSRISLEHEYLIEEN